MKGVYGPNLGDLGPPRPMGRAKAWTHPNAPTIGQENEITGRDRGSAQTKKGVHQVFIGISGTHGTGKTTLLYKLAHDLKIRHPHKSVRVISEVARSCPLQTFQGQSKAGEESQIWIFAAQIKAELEARQAHDIVLSDRTVYDVIAYTMEVNEDLALEMFGVGQRMHYDQVYFVRPAGEGWVTDDGGRSLDLALRGKIDKNLERIFSMKDLNVKEIKIWRGDE